MKILTLFVLLSLPCPATSYYLANASTSPAGSDSNNGLSVGAPWLSPNHALNCGDTITAAASTTYSATNFASGKWGTVTCGGGNNVAWLQCSVFDACKIGTISAGNGMTVTSSFWGVQGWEVDGTSESAYCFLAQPPTSTAGANIHHIILANDIATGCGSAGLESGNNGLAGVDYFVVVGSIAYGTAGGSTSCGSGLYDFEPVATDTLPGTHIYFAGNFSWHNQNPAICGGTSPTDGEGLIFDTFDGRYTSSLPIYAQQAVADNNILIGNGGRGIEVVNNNTGSGPWATIYFRHNTIWGNNLDSNATYGAYICGETLLLATATTTAIDNLVASAATDGCDSGTTPIYLFWVTNSATVTNGVYGNFGYAAAGTNGGINSSTGFAYGVNVFGTSPQFVNASIPGSPSCGSSSSVPNCMAGVVANFTPMAASAIGYGYQMPGSASVYDPLYPSWLCNVTLPAGLVTPGCSGASHVVAGNTVSGGSVVSQ